jgi:adenylate cyclase
VQAEVSKKIVEALRLTLSPGEREMLDRAPTRNAEAYALYLRARELIDVTRETNREAEALLRRALELDPDFPLGLAAMGEVHAIRALRWWATPRESAEPALGFARRALELEPDLADAHLLMARIHWLNGDHANLIDSIERVLRLDPDHFEGLLLAGWSYMSHGMVERARPILEYAVQRHPQSYMASEYLINCYEMLGHQEDVERMRQLAFERALEHVRRHPGREGAHARSILALRLGTMGRVEEGLEQIKRGLEVAPDDGRLHYNAACFYAREGRVEEAVRELKEGTRNLSSFMGEWPRHDPDMQNLRDHPEFVKMFGAASKT